MKHRRILTSFLLVLSVAALWTGGLRPVRAASIGVNFTDGASNLSPASVAGVPGSAQSHYNNVQTAGSALMDNRGLVTSASFTVGPGFPSSSTGVPRFAGADETLMSGFIAGNTGATGGIVFNLSGIPYASYSLLVYAITGNGSATQSLTVGTTTFYGTTTSPSGPGYVDNDPATAFIYTRAVSVSLTAPTQGANYALFTGLSGATQKLTVLGFNADTASEVNGFQIIETVPEPRAWMLLLASGLTFLLFRSRPRRSRA